MTQDIVFAAPWGKPLRIISLISGILLIGMSFLLFFVLNQAPDSNSVAIVAPWIPLLIEATAAVFIVRRYQLSGDTLIIHRLGWSNQYDLSQLVSISHDPAAVKGSIRSFGNGGLLSFSGIFWNKTLGSYRAYATDWSKALVIKLPNRVLVITPDNPEEFIKAVAKNRSEHRGQATM